MTTFGIYSSTKLLHVGGMPILRHLVAVYAAHAISMSELP